MVQRLITGRNSSNMATCQCGCSCNTDGSSHTATHTLELMALCTYRQKCDKTSTQFCRERASPLPQLEVLADLWELSKDVQAVGYTHDSRCQHRWPSSSGLMCSNIKVRHCLCSFWAQTGGSRPEATQPRVDLTTSSQSQAEHLAGRLC